MKKRWKKNESVKERKERSISFFFVFFVSSPFLFSFDDGESAQRGRHSDRADLVRPDRAGHGPAGVAGG